MVLLRAPARPRHPRMPRLRATTLFLLLVFAVAPTGADNGEQPVLHLEGGTSAQRENIRNSLNLARYPCELPDFRVRRMLRETEELARDALRAIGYYDAVLETAFEPTESCWELHIEFEPGPPTTIGLVDIQITGEGARDLAFEAVRLQPGIEPGDVLRHDQYEALRNRLTRIAADRGYFDADLHTRRLEIDREDRRAHIRLHMDSGDRYRLGAVTIDQDILAPEFVQRLIPFDEGDPYSSAQVIALQSNLNASNYFSAARVRPLRDEAEDGLVPVLVELEPRKRHGYEGAIGYSTDIGPRLRLRYDHRYATEHGHRYHAELEASPVRSGIGFNYEIPLDDPLRERLNLFTSYRTEDTDTQTSERFRIGASRVLQHANGWQTTEGLRYEYEDYTVGDDSGHSRLLIPSYTVSRREADDPMTPRRGYRVEGTLQAASDVALSTTSFAQVIGSAKVVRGFGRGRVLVRGDAGLTDVDAVDDLPGSLRFFAGGDASIRGYKFQSLGPRDDTGEVTGGRHKLVGSVEYDYPLAGRWSAAAFVDGGNAFDRFDDYRAVYGYGVGVRWRSPVGPLRLDIAHGPDSDDNFRIHFTMGPDL